jgi:protein O-GlcNAc transferase
VTGRLQDQAADAELARGLGLHRAGRLGEAEAAYRAALARNADHPHAMNYLGVLLAAAGRNEEALDLLRRSVKRLPSVPEFHLNLADVLIGLGRLDGAETALRKALHLKRSAAALTKMGQLLYRLGRTRPAVHQFEQALALDPSHLDARQNLGTVLAQLGESDRARGLLRGALAVAPTHAGALNTLAALAQTNGDMAEATRHLGRVLALEPGLAPAHANLGLVLETLGSGAAAARHSRKALALSPADAHVWSNVGNLMHGLRQPADSERMLLRSLGLDASSAGTWSNLGRVLNAQARFVPAVAAYRQALALDPLHVAARSNLLFLSHFDPSFTAERILAEHIAFGRLHEPRFERERRPHANPREPERRLRVGYVSSDFGRHPVGYFLRQVLPHHDPAMVEVFCYSDRMQEDDLTMLFRDASTAFRRVVGMSDDALAALVRSDGIDVLVDLNGHTAGHRLLVFARKPAPVQASWLGYYDTTGLTTMDAVLADPWEVEPGDERWYVEKVQRLPTGRLCYGPPAEAPEVGPLPAAAQGFVTFASFNNVAKLTDRVVAVWSELLRRLPTARIVFRSGVLADAGYRGRFLQRFEAHGIDRERLDAAATTPQGALEAYGSTDIALDPFPFPGGLTTCEALWMGVPVVTMKGAHPVTRQSVSFLGRVGLPDLVATDEASYVEIVLALARDPGRMAELRRGLRTRMSESTLTDGAAGARALEQAYRSLWRDWCGRAS